MTFIDLDNIVAGILQHLQQLSQADYVAFTVPEEGWKTLRAAWAGNRISHDKLEVTETMLRASVLSDGIPVIKEIDGSDISLAVFLLRLRGLDGCTVTLAWRGEMPHFTLASGQSMVDIAALALENSHEYQKQQYYIQSLEYLGNLSSELNIMQSIDQVVSHIQMTAYALLDVERCAVFLSQDDKIYEVHSRQLSPDFIHDLTGTSLNIWTSASRSTLAGQPLPYQASGQDINALVSPWREVYQRENIQSFSMALMCGHDVLGAIGLYYDRPYTPTDQELQLFEILAAQTAVALDNIKLNRINDTNREMLERSVQSRTQELAIALDKAEDADRLKTQLLSTVSHELRTPLAVIKAHASTIKGYYDKLPKEKQMNYISTINDEADRLNELINGLLEMSQLETGNLHVRTIDFEPLGFLVQTAERLQVRYPAQPFKVMLPPTLRRISADPERVRQVIYNLIDNALKYSPPDHSVEFGAQSWSDGLEIWVKDEGIGIAPELRKRVFERFYQVDNSNQLPRAGVGLGLSICKALVEEMGGRIWCQSEGANKGSRFAFIIPWASDNSVGLNVPLSTP